MTVPCCVDSRNMSDTYAKGYTVCGKCRRRYDLTARGWRATPDPAPRRWGK